MSERTVIVVLGMHRSGTSAVTRGLTVLGVDLGDRMMPPMVGNNETGFWEDIEINALNDEVLQALGHRWDSVGLIDPEALRGPRLASLRRRGAQLLDEKMTHAPVFGFKDPRVCRLLPMWQAVLHTLGANVRYVIVLRNPLSVAPSLAARDGFSARKSYLLWIGHVIPVMIGTEGTERVVVDYDILMEEPQRELERMATALNREIQSKGLAEFSGGFLRQDLRHQAFDAKALARAPGLPKLAADAYICLRELARGRVSADDPAQRAEWRRLERAWLDLAPALEVADEESQERRDAQQLVVKRDDEIALLHETVIQHAAAARRRHHTETVDASDIHLSSLRRTIAERDARIASLKAEHDRQMLAQEDAAAAQRTLVAASAAQANALRERIGEQDRALARSRAERYAASAGKARQLLVRAAKTVLWIARRLATTTRRRGVLPEPSSTR